jgi:toxin ParE1/3/4
VTYRVVFAPEALDQLRALRDYVAERRDLAVARGLVTSIADYCESFGTFPHRGTRRDDIRPGLRTIGFRRIVTIAFVVESRRVAILGIFYGGRDIEAALRDDSE